MKLKDKLSLMSYAQMKGALFGGIGCLCFAIYSLIFLDDVKASIAVMVFSIVPFWLYSLWRKTYRQDAEQFKAPKEKV